MLNFGTMNTDQRRRGRISAAAVTGQGLDIDGTVDRHIVASQFRHRMGSNQSRHWRDRPAFHVTLPLIWTALAP